MHAQQQIEINEVKKHGWHGREAPDGRRMHPLFLGCIGGRRMHRGICVNILNENMAAVDRPVFDNICVSMSLQCLAG